MTTPQIVPPDKPDKTDEIAALIARGLRAAGRYSYGDFVPKGYLAYAGSAARVVTGVGIVALMGLRWYQTGQLPDDSMLGSAVAAYLAGTGMTDAGNRRNEDSKV